MVRTVLRLLILIVLLYIGILCSDVKTRQSHTRHSPNVGLILPRHPQRWPYEKPTLVQHIAFPGLTRPATIRYSTKVSSMLVCAAGPTLSQHWINVSCLPHPYSSPDIANNTCKLLRSLSTWILKDGRLGSAVNPWERFQTKICLSLWQTVVFLSLIHQRKNGAAARCIPDEMEWSCMISGMLGTSCRLFCSAKPKVSRYRLLALHCSKHWWRSAGAYF